MSLLIDNLKNLGEISSVEGRLGEELGVMKDLGGGEVPLGPGGPAPSHEWGEGRVTGAPHVAVDGTPQQLWFPVLLSWSKTLTAARTRKQD